MFAIVCSNTRVTSADPTPSRVRRRTVTLAVFAVPSLTSIDPP
jgi:hypothetical protein